MNRVVFSGPRWLLAATLLGATGGPFITPPRVVWAQAFKLGTDDVIAVQVAKHPEMSAAEVSVGGNGKVALPLIGDLTVSGLTLAQTQAAVRQKLRQQLRNPQVTVALVRSRPRQVIALGAVSKPGPIDVQPGWRISEVLSAAGGLALPIESVKATLARPKMPLMALDLKQIGASPQNSANVRVQAGDVVNIAPLPTIQVVVSGEVMTPSAVTLRKSPRALDAIVAAGNLKEKPELMRGTVLRNGATKITLDLPAIFSDVASPANIPLQDGDLLSLETIRTNVTVMSVDNLVKEPGSFQFGPDATAVEALVKAGGLTIPAEGVVATIRRGAQVLPVNLVEAVYNPSKDVSMREGDILLLAFPEGPQITITGGVARPGTIRVKEGTSLLDAVINGAGGLTFKPDQIRLSVLRTMPDGKQITMSIDPVALFDLRDLGQNMKMQNGDLVIINQGAVSQSVFVGGEVVAKGSYDINPKDGLPEVILRANGPTKMAALSRVSVTRRDGTTHMVDVSRSFEANAPKLDFPLQEGDIVVVPPIQDLVLVMNAVNAPGYYPIPEKGTLTIGDAILAAGGAKTGAKLKEVAILHRNPDGTVDKKLVSLSDVRNGIMSIDAPLKAGDIIFVPEGKVGPTALTKVASVVGGMTTLFRFGTVF